jgi:hypothetical protein
MHVSLASFAVPGSVFTVPGAGNPGGGQYTYLTFVDATHITATPTIAAGNSLSGTPIAGNVTINISGPSGLGMDAFGRAVVPSPFVVTHASSTQTSASGAVDYPGTAFPGDSTWHTLYTWPDAVSLDSTIVMMATVTLRLVGISGFTVIRIYIAAQNEGGVVLNPDGATGDRVIDSWPTSPVTPSGAGAQFAISGTSILLQVQALQSFVACADMRVTINGSPTAPSLTSVSAPFTAATSPSTSETLTGTNLNRVTAAGVLLNSVKYPLSGFANVGSTSITGVLPSGVVGRGAWYLTVGGQDTITNVPFWYLGAAVPSGIAVTPNTGPTTGGTIVAIVGSGLTGLDAPGGGVLLDGVAATVVSVTDDGHATITSGIGSAGTGNVIVTTPVGSSAPLVNGWTYFLAPILGLISNSNVNTGTSVTPFVGSVPGTNITVGEGPYKPAISFDGTKALIPCFTANTIVPLTMGVGNVWTAGTAVVVPGTNPGPTRCVIARDNIHALVVCFNNGTVVPVTYTGGVWVMGTALAVGSRMYDAEISADGSFAIVTDTNAVSLYVLAYDEPDNVWAVVQTIPSPAHTYGIAISPNGQQALATSPTNGTSGLIPLTFTGSVWTAGSALPTTSNNTYRVDISQDGVHALVAGGTTVQPWKYTSGAWVEGTPVTVAAGAWDVSIGDDGLSALVTCNASGNSAQLLALTGDTWAISGSPIAAGTLPQFGEIWRLAKAINGNPRTIPTVTPSLSNPFIPVGGVGTWDNGQIDEPVVMSHPTDPTKVRVYYAAFAPSGSANGGIGWTDVSNASTGGFTNPANWVKYSGNPILTGNIRLDSMIDVGTLGSGGTRYLYSTNITTDNVALYSSTDGSIFTLVNSAVLTPSGSESIVSQLSVINDGGTYRGYYCYRTASLTLPGIRGVTATSPAGPWTRVNGGNDLISTTANTPWSKYMEWMQVLPPSVLGGGNYGLIVGCFDNKRWTTQGFCSTNPSSGWAPMPLNPILDTTYEGLSNATTAFYEVDGTWYLAYQYTSLNAFSGSYSSNTWNVGIATFSGGSPGAFI